MSDQSVPGAAGAFDLSGVAVPTTGTQPGAAARDTPQPGAPRSGAQEAVNSGLVVEGTDATFNQLVNRSVSVPAVLALWASSVPQTAPLVQVLAEIAGDLEGRIQVIAIDLDHNPGVAQALQGTGVPVALGLLQGQPVPLFQGVLPKEQARAYVDELLKLAVQHGVTGRVSVAAADDEMPPLPPLHQEAFDAIERGDLPAARAAYEQALALNPKDHDAEIGLAQVGLLERTSGIDSVAVRHAAAEDPSDIQAQLDVADLDLLGGHVADAFTRLIDLVRVTSGDERERIKAHLIELFAVVGNHDERVKKGRTMLMSALF
ncbi:tetratricopeptide repeat protein [Kribbia dieselivorans]|uniref:tetratricopeptide repeat protein n=1 Tax=Kribbia dieselivorans TaxID=331526 RepID=UPI000838A8F8|nr:tetratricopeptide repeat protein [Kribbia dieselivorans]